MNKQITLSTLTDELSQAKTRKKEFLAQMNRMIPWNQWEGIIKPYYYKGERGNKPYELETMLRIHILQELYSLADMAVMNEVIDSRAFSEFCGIDSSNQVPDGDTIGRFRALMVKHGLQKELFTQVVELLEEQGLILKKGSIVDSTIIAAPSSTKNREKRRDPEAHQTKKGNTWHFGYKAHIGVDKSSGLVHHVEVTAANVHDVTMVANLLYGEEESVHGDSGYLGAEKREEAITHNKRGKKIRYNQSQTLAKQAKHDALQGSDQTAGEGEVIRAGEGRACIWCCERAVRLSKDAIQRATKTGGQTAYALRAGESGSG